MLGFGGVKRKAREFHYTPVFWDKEKEEREERRRAILGDDYQSGEYKPGSMIRENRMRRMRSSARVQRSSRSTLIRVAIFVALVFFALYYMTDVFSKFM
ncbi:MAG: hypothetical protein RSF93_00135 [Mucinivorans sp.]